MQKVEYLYGVKEAYWHELAYDRALKLKIELAKDVISILNSKPYLVKTNEDGSRINACLKAIDFNEGLLNE